MCFAGPLASEALIEVSNTTSFKSCSNTRIREDCQQGNYHDSASCLRDRARKVSYGFLSMPRASAVQVFAASRRGYDSPGPHRLSDGSATWERRRRTTNVPRDVRCSCHSCSVVGAGREWMTVPGARLGFAKLPGGEAATNSRKLDFLQKDACTVMVHTRTH